MTKIQQASDPQTVAQFLSKQLIAFNRAHWDVTVKEEIAFSVTSETDEIVAGLSGVTFGNWLHIERLWVSESLRGKGTGSELLKAAEDEARRRGCQFALLDTLEFQARPFYERHGYQVQWTQTHYPLHGAKYYMTKTL
jgi:GNAT superfamily N-acetyltransferase